MNIKDKKPIVMIVITLLDLFINIFNNVRTAETGVGMAVACGIVLALCDILLLFSIIEIANKPVLGMLLLTLSQLFTFIFELLDGATVSEAFTDMGVIGIVVMVALLYHVTTSYKEVSKDKQFVSTWKDKILNTLHYKRTIYNVKLYTRLIIYSLIISTTFSLAGSDMMQLFNDSISFRLYSAFVLIVPTLLIIGVITTSYIAYDIFVVKILFELYTIYLLASIGRFDFIQIFYIIVEVIAIGYAYFVTFSDNNKKVGEKHEKKKK